MKELSLNQQTMTLKEITDLLSVRHNDAFNKVEKMSKSNDFGLIRTVRISYKKGKNAIGEINTFVFDKRQSIIVAAALNTDLLIKVVDKWIELERKEQLKAESEKLRNELRLEYKPMTDAILESRQELGKETKFFHFSNEADLLNRIVLGITSAKFRAFHNVSEKESIRDYLTFEQKNALSSLQRANTVYIDEGLNFEERKWKLIALFNKKYNEKLINETHLLGA